ncbi:SRPBCC family protein [Flavobacterium degerlachei]|jgi:effector-binding domain-containing protein|uniref:Polyketide cyclase / dehydrase and lipid transport n=1 Tax=Flavobacterium degerlachei TaxID=229203 RepID=A0A1H2SKY9_9FLAO|nr:SRPBCC family protein [Flavobacterium degerlachei]SDW32177.1 Polyketide cyclase / dehydrase and lipid transport [Flavobacterium degerlachei]
MRILKYIFLLLLLSLVALSIFMATQKGDFNVERSKFINSAKPVVYNYVNDYKNWEDFGSWTTEDPEIKISYPQKTIGPGASYSWEGKEGEGQMRTLFVKENDSISQKMNFNGTEAKVSWRFKDTIGGTKVTWRSAGKMSFMFKIYAALNGGVDKVIGTMYEKSLANLDKALDYEINTFSIEVDGLVKKPQLFYLSQTFTSEIAKINKNFKVVIPKIEAFCQENNVQINGKPFVIYHTYDLTSGLAKISICLPIKSEIFTSAGSDILSGKLEAFEAVKTTMVGDISHNKKGYDKTIEYMSKNQLTINPVFSHIEIYSTSKVDIKSPSKWVTEIYVPLIPKIIPVKAYVPVATKTAEPSAEQVVPSVAEPAKVIKTPIKTSEPKKPVAPKVKEEEPSEF